MDTADFVKAVKEEAWTARERWAEQHVGHSVYAFTPKMGRVGDASIELFSDYCESCDERFRYELTTKGR